MLLAAWYVHAAARSVQARHSDRGGACTESVHQTVCTQPCCLHLPPLCCHPPCRSMPFIMKSRGLSRAVGMSQLLDTSPDIKVPAGLPAWLLLLVACVCVCVYGRMCGCACIGSVRRAQCVPFGRQEPDCCHCAKGSSPLPLCPSSAAEGVL